MQSLNITKEEQDAYYKANNTSSVAYLEKQKALKAKTKLEAEKAKESLDKFIKEQQSKPVDGNPSESLGKFIKEQTKLMEAESSKPMEMDPANAP